MSIQSVHSLIGQPQALVTGSVDVFRAQVTEPLAAVQAREMYRPTDKRDAGLSALAASRTASIRQRCEQAVQTAWRRPEPSARDLARHSQVVGASLPCPIARFGGMTGDVSIAP